MAPSSAVKPAPTWAAKATPGDERRDLAGVGEAADEAGERLGADLLEALEALEADLGAGEERHREDDEDHAAADDQGAGADGDVGRRRLKTTLAVLAP